MTLEEWVKNHPEFEGSGFAEKLRKSNVLIVYANDDRPVEFWDAFLGVALKNFIELSAIQKVIEALTGQERVHFHDYVFLIQREVLDPAEAIRLEEARTWLNGFLKEHPEVKAHLYQAPRRG